jgi:hypothetical protein
MGCAYHDYQTATSQEKKDAAMQDMFDGVIKLDEIMHQMAKEINDAHGNMNVHEHEPNYAMASWINPDGVLIPCNVNDHWYAAQVLVQYNELQLSSGLFDYSKASVDEQLLHSHWIKIQGVKIYSCYGINPRQAKTIRQYLELNGITDVIYNTNHAISIDDLFDKMMRND